MTFECNTVSGRGRPLVHTYTPVVTGSYTLTHTYTHLYTPPYMTTCTIHVVFPCLAVLLRHATTGRRRPTTAIAARRFRATTMSSAVITYLHRRWSLMIYGWGIRRDVIVCPAVYILP